MKTLHLFLFAALVSIVSDAQTRNNSAALLDSSDKRLSDVYQMLLAAKRSDADFVRNLRTSQRVWMQFRDAEFTLKYPHHRPLNKRDSLPEDQALYLRHLTDNRTRVLLNWITSATGGLVQYSAEAGLDDAYAGRNSRQDIQMGSVSVPQTSRPTGEAWTPVYEISVTFPKPFDKAPRVFLSLSQVEVYSRKSGTFFRLLADNVTPTGFVLRVEGAYASSFSNCTVTWTALESE